MKSCQVWTQKLRVAETYLQSLYNNGNREQGDILRVLKVHGHFVI